MVEFGTLLEKEKNIVDARLISFGFPCNSYDYYEWQEDINYLKTNITKKINANDIDRVILYKQDNNYFTEEYIIQEKISLSVYNSHDVDTIRKETQPNPKEFLKIALFFLSFRKDPKYMTVGEIIRCCRTFKQYQPEKIKEKSRRYDQKKGILYIDY